MHSLQIANAALNGVILGLLLALPTLAITLVFGIARFPNAATGDYMTFGAYTAVVAQTVGGASLIVSGIIATMATGLVALFFYAWVFRPLASRAPAVPLIASIGVAFTLRSVITFFAGYSQYTIGISPVRAWNFNGIRVLPTDIYIVLVASIALLLIFFMLRFTTIGRQMRAVADNPELAGASGISSRKIMLLVWSIAGVYSGLGGVLLGIKAVVIPELGWELLIPMFAAVILGGIGNPLGAVVGMLLFGVSEEIASLYVGASYKIVMAFLVLLLVLLMRPQGLFGRFQAVR